MSILDRQSFNRSAAVASATVAVSLVLVSCNQQSSPITGAQTDLIPPTVFVSSSGAATGQLLSVVLDANDNLGLSAASFDANREVTTVDSVTGDTTVTTTTLVNFDTTFTTAVTTFSRTLDVPVSAVGRVVMLGTATDGAGNLSSVSDTLQAGGAIPTLVIETPQLGFLARHDDSVRVRVTVNDSIGISKVTLDGVAHRGVDTLGTDFVVQRLAEKEIVFGSASLVIDTAIVRDLLPVDPAAGIAETVWVRAFVTGTSGAVVSDSVAIQAVGGPTLSIERPDDGVQLAPGVSQTIEIRTVSSGSGVGFVGYETSGAITIGDTTQLRSPTLTDTTVTFTLAVPASAPLGSFQLTPVGTDFSGQIGAGRAINIDIVSVAGASDSVPPLVTVAVESRIERQDSITITAQDVQGGAGIASMGFNVEDENGTLITTASTTFATLEGSQTVTFELGLQAYLPLSLDPEVVVVTAFATDAATNQGFASKSGSPIGVQADAAVEVLTLVAGRTEILPAGGQIADAIYNPNKREIYLSNITLDRIEVFDVDTRQFVGNIPVGSRPWGLALWPSTSAARTNDDMLVVANSGGTNLSVVDLNVGAVGAEIRRHNLPQYQVAQVKVELSEETGLPVITRVVHDFSDRPQFLGLVCRDLVGGVCGGEVHAVYSTAPTPAQGDFPLRGTMRSEYIGTAAPAAFQSHFFWEHATFGAGSQAFDTLEVIARRIGGTNETLIGAGCGVAIDFKVLAMLDTTFVRNSGDYTHVFAGEGGSGDPIFGFARVLGYNVSGVQEKRVATCQGGAVPTAGFLGGYQEDTGWLNPVFTIDFLSNTATPVRSVAVNFNGLTNLVRADSIYVLDENLKLVGLMQSDGDNPGVDMRFDHCFNASSTTIENTCAGPLGSLSTKAESRLAYAARGDASVDVFDTRFFGRVRAAIPIKRAIIGPVRAAELDPVTGAQIVIGVTSEGVVTIDVQNVLSTFPLMNR